MNKVFNRVNWQNLPSKATALSANNLNRGDSALNEIDNRVITLDTTKADKTEINDLVQSITFNSNTGTFTIKKKSGATTIIDTDLEKVAVNFEYDSNNRQLVLYDASHQVVARVDLSDFITVNEFNDSDTIVFRTEDSSVSAEVKDGSITGDKLQPNYLADIQVQAALANTSAEDAAESASDASDNKDLTEQYRDEAKGYRDEAERFATSDYALEAQSYAIGGTGTREGEDTDNAKYYKEVAEQQTITNITATVDDEVGTPEVEVTHTSPAPNNSFRFDFKNMKGEQGDKGDTGTGIIDAYLNDDSHLILVYDDGTEVDAGLAGTNIKQMTKAEYAALSDEEKNDDGMYYWITDENGEAMTIIVASIVDYNEMTNKPKINGVTLEGDKSLEDLGIEGNIKEISLADFDELPDSEKNNEDIYWWIKGGSSGGGGGGGGLANLTVVTKTYSAPFKSNGYTINTYQLYRTSTWSQIEFEETNYPGCLLIPICIQPKAYFNTDKTGENVGYRLIARPFKIKEGAINILIGADYPNWSTERVTDDNGDPLTFHSTTKPSSDSDITGNGYYYMQNLYHYFFGATITFLVVPK